MDDAAALLSASPVAAIAFAFTSSAYAIGPRGEAHMPARLEGRTQGLPVVATCAAAVEALRVLGAGRLALVDPPWFDDTLSQLGQEPGPRSRRIRSHRVRTALRPGGPVTHGR
ncbi:hypothetical protein ABT084_16165 [Streptomyces sp. NPDC002138]|uniref:hypothetical protein n=1 Tax=Streptomyces sp. NPDC002138 TaxID=3154410 RepID=UPI00332F0AA8